MSFSPSDVQEKGSSFRHSNGHLVFNFPVHLYFLWENRIDGFNTCMDKYLLKAINKHIDKLFLEDENQVMHPYFTNCSSFIKYIIYQNHIFCFYWNKKYQFELISIELFFLLIIKLHERGFQFIFPAWKDICNLLAD